MADAQVKWYGDDFLAELRGATHDVLFEAGEKFIEMAASRAPRDEGDLRESGYVASEKKSTYKSKKGNRKPIRPPQGGVIAAFADWKAHLVEYGAKPHTIGRPGQVLRMRDGSLVRGPLKHPGTRAQPFFRSTLDEAQAQLGDVVTVSLRRKLKK